jgi:hypothetical protein
MKKKAKLPTSDELKWLYDILVGVDPLRAFLAGFDAAQAPPKDFIRESLKSLAATAPKTKE